MILEFLKYCYFWIDILGFLTQTFEPVPPVCLVMECPLGGNNMETKGHLFSQGGTQAFLWQECSSKNKFQLPKKIEWLYIQTQKIECPKIQTQKNRMTQASAMLVKVWINMESYYDFMFFSTVCSSFKGFKCVIQK